MGWFSRSAKNVEGGAGKASAGARAQGNGQPSPPRFPVLAEPEELDPAFALPLAIIYKHSTRCSTSSYALREVRKFAANRPELAVFLIDVHAGRDASDEIERRTGVRHESPQILVLRSGEVAWAGSHSEVMAATLTRVMDALDVGDAVDVGDAAAR